MVSQELMELIVVKVRVNFGQHREKLGKCGFQEFWNIDRFL